MRLDAIYTSADILIHRHSLSQRCAEGYHLRRCGSSMEMGHGKESDLTERAGVFLDVDHEGGTIPSVPLSGGFFAEIVT